MHVYILHTHILMFCLNKNFLTVYFISIIPIAVQENRFWEEEWIFIQAGSLLHYGMGCVVYRPSGLRQDYNSRTSEVDAIMKKV